MTKKIIEVDIDALDGEDLAVQEFVLRQLRHGSPEPVRDVFQPKDPKVIARHSGTDASRRFQEKQRGGMIDMTELYNPSKGKANS